MIKNLIILAICLYYAPLVELHRLRDADAWKASFNRIFGEGSSLTEPQLMQSMVSLHSSAEKFDTLDENDKQKVEFWFRELFGSETDDDAANCNAEYMATLSEIYAQQSSKDSFNLEKLYNLSRARIIDYCQDYFSDLPDRLALLVPEAKMVDLMDAYTERTAAHSGLDLFKSLVKPVRDSIRTRKLSSASEFMNKWSEGSCSVLCSALQRPDMTQYLHFVEMCLYEPENVSSISSDTIRQWIYIISMCKHINDFIIPEITQSIDQSTILLQNMWERTYQEIFGTDIKVASMGDRTLMRSMTFLHANADRFPTIEPEKLSKVKFWYEALYEFDIFDCNVEYLSRTRDIYWEQNHMANANFELLYCISTKNVIGFCDRLLISMPERLAAQVADENLFSFLTGDNPEADLTPLSNPDLAEMLADRAIKSMEDGIRGAEVLEIWRKSPCTDIQKAMEEPDLDDYGNFIDMSLYEAKYLRYCSSVNFIWIRVVYICTILDRWIPMFAETNSWAIRARRNLRYFFTKYSLRQLMHSPISVPKNPEISPDLPEERLIEVDDSSIRNKDHRSRPN